MKLEVDIEKLAFGGRGIARYENQVVFVDNGIPGDHALVWIRKKKKQHAEAKIVELLTPSPLRQPAPCTHFGYCGGCKWQHLDYHQQLRYKKEQVLESLQHIAGIQSAVVPDTLASPLIFGYRNKTEFSFTENRWLTPDELRDDSAKKDFTLGFHVPGSFEWVMRIDNCWLQDETMNGILNFSREYFKKSGLPVFGLRSHAGLLRFLVLRKSFRQNQYMVNVVTFEPADEALREYTKLLTDKFPNVSSIINTVNRRFAQIAFGEEEHLLFGNPVITEQLGGFYFAISANSFFQTNPLQAENLYNIVRKYTGQGYHRIWDLYSGTGTIALFLSDLAEEVTGFEIVESAVNDAVQNCRMNKISNCKFVAGDLRRQLMSREDAPEVVVCDPPRAGMHPEVVEAILEKAPRRIVYISCNPATMARDIKMMIEKYEMKEVQPVDMFPHTFHIESVARLEKK
ncbi:MAG: 23S rRNA (uracil(1939)-C(5))-methyltransferase RlmD [Calditrichia bacterium]